MDNVQSRQISFGSEFIGTLRTKQIERGAGYIDQADEQKFWVEIFHSQKHSHVSLRLPLPAG